MISRKRDSLTPTQKECMKSLWRFFYTHYGTAPQGLATLPDPFIEPCIRNNKHDLAQVGSYLPKELTHFIKSVNKAKEMYNHDPMLFINTCYNQFGEDKGRATSIISLTQEEKDHLMYWRMLYIDYYDIDLNDKKRAIICNKIPSIYKLSLNKIQLLMDLELHLFVTKIINTPPQTGVLLGVESILTEMRALFFPSKLMHASPTATPPMMRRLRPPLI